MNHYEQGINSMWEEVEGKGQSSPHIPTETEEWEELKKEFYGKKCGVQTGWGIIDFDPNEMNNVVGGEKLTYDEYLDIMRISASTLRYYFQLCFYDCFDVVFKGQIEKITKENICFKRIFISGMYLDGTCLDGKEDHVWMKRECFEDYKVGDCLSFTAEIYRYVKTSNGKRIDFALRNPEEIKIIEAYKIPSDDDLLMDSIDRLVCESCMFNEHCYMGMCIANEEWRENTKKMLFEAAKARKV